MNITNSSGLLKDEERLQRSTNQRAAACFPIFNLKKTDLKITFQNYWKWKRNIDIYYKATIRNKNGIKIYELPITKPKDQNIIPVREIMDKHQIEYEKLIFGSIEVEIISKENIVFPFPAILAYYESVCGFISVVHSAGRTLENSNTDYETFNETNFYVSENQSYNPFVHIFNGAEGVVKNLKITINSFNENNYSLTFDIEKQLQPYESEVFFLSEYLEIYKKQLIKSNIKTSEDLSYDTELGVLISGSSKSIYPRFVCGNYDLKNDHPFVTHTFRKINEANDVVSVPDIQASSTIALSRSEEIDIKALVFPTTSPNKNHINATFYDLDEKNILNNFKNLDISNQGKSFFINEKYYDNSVYNIGLEVSPSRENIKELPARIPVSIRYSLKRNNKSLPTDIALQLRTSFAGVKTNFWYQGYFKEHLTHLLFLSQLVPGTIPSGFRSNENLEFTFYLKVSGYDQKSIDFSFKKSEISIQLNLIDIYKKLFINNPLVEDSLYSWRIKLSNGTLQDIYCVSFDEQSGIIFGEHSF